VFATKLVHQPYIGISRPRGRSCAGGCGCVRGRAGVHTCRSYAAWGDLTGVLRVNGFDDWEARLPVHAPQREVDAGWRTSPHWWWGARHAAPGGRQLNLPGPGGRASRQQGGAINLLEVAQTGEREVAVPMKTRLRDRDACDLSVRTGQAGQMLLKAYAEAASIDR